MLRRHFQSGFECCLFLLLVGLLYGEHEQIVFVACLPFKLMCSLSIHCSPRRVIKTPAHVLDLLSTPQHTTLHYTTPHQPDLTKVDYNKVQFIAKSFHFFLFCTFFFPSIFGLFWFFVLAMMKRTRRWWSSGWWWWYVW